jgi:hypothetical protein
VGELVGRLVGSCVGIGVARSLESTIAASVAVVYEVYEVVLSLARTIIQARQASMKPDSEEPPRIKTHSSSNSF